MSFLRISYHLAQALPILKAAWDCGINTIDTANMYSNGVSEQIIASFIRQVRRRRVSRLAVPELTEYLGHSVQHSEE